MSIIILTPIVGLSFTALTPLILAAAGAMGYKAMVDMKDGGDLNDHLRHQIREMNTVEIMAPNLIREAGEELRVEKSMAFRKGDITLTLERNERGSLTIRVTGPKEASKATLRELGDAFAQEIAQQFAFNRAVEEIERLNAEVVGEEKLDNGEIRVRFRRWH
jgi:hypothetical protein